MARIFTHEAACDWARVFSEEASYTESGKSEVARVHFIISQIQDFNTMPGRLTFANAGSALQAELRATALSRRAAILSYLQGLPMIFEVAGTVPALACMASWCSGHPLLVVAKAEPSSLETRVSAPPTTPRPAYTHLDVSIFSTCNLFASARVSKRVRPITMLMSRYFRNQISRHLAVY